jgi:hypothetical protein
MGSAILASMGSTRNSRVALRNIETAKTISSTETLAPQTNHLAVNPQVSLVNAALSRKTDGK